MEVRDITLIQENINDIPIVMTSETENEILNGIRELKDDVAALKISVAEYQSTYSNVVIEIQETLKIILSKLNNNFSTSENIVKDDKIMHFLPLYSTEQLINFEDLLKSDQEAFTQLVSIVLFE